MRARAERGRRAGDAAMIIAEARLVEIGAAIGRRISGFGAGYATAVEPALRLGTAGKPDRRDGYAGDRAGNDLSHGFLLCFLLPLYPVNGAVSAALLPVAQKKGAGEGFAGARNGLILATGLAAGAAGWPRSRIGRQPLRLVAIELVTDRR